MPKRKADRKYRRYKRLGKNLWKNSVPFYGIALVYCALGNNDAAFQALESGYAEHDEDLFLIGLFEIGPTILHFVEPSGPYRFC